MRTRSRILTTIGAAAGAGLAAYGATRLLTRRARRRVDPYVGTRFEPEIDREHAIESSDGSKLHVVERGEGIPIVLAHGVTNDHRTWFHQLVDLPERGIRAIAFDQRGHGRSTVGDAGFGAVPLADDLAAILEDLDLHDAVLVGHSMGGMGVQALACHRPEVVQERVAGLVLIGTTSHALPFWRSLERIPERVLSGSDAWLDRLLLHDDLGYLTTRIGMGRRPHGSHVDLVRRMILECPVTTRRAATRGLLGYDVRELLCDVAVPVLVVCGTRDVLTPPATSRRIAAAIPGCGLRMIPDAGHMPMLEAADEVTELLAEFAHDAVRSRARAHGGSRS